MESKVLELFDSSQYIARNKCGQEEFISEIYDDIPIFIRIFNEAFDMMNSAKDRKKSHRYISRNWHSVEMNGNIKGLLIDHYGFQQGILEDSSGRFFFQKNNKFKLYFKKLDHRRRPSNVPTRNNLLIKKQLSPDQNDVKTNLFIGYQVDPGWMKLTGIFAVCFDDDRMVWCTDLEKLRSSVFEDRIDQIQESSTKRKVSVHLKKKSHKKSS